MSTNDRNAVRRTTALRIHVASFAIVSLVLFALLLTLQDELPGRVFCLIGNGRTSNEVTLCI